MAQPSNGLRPAAVLVLLVVIAAIVLVAVSHPGLIRFWPFSAGEFVQLLTPLFLVSLFIERALEVFVTSWRGEESDKIDIAIATAKRQLPPAQPAAPNVVDPAAFANLSLAQQRLFVVGDVLLTGAAIGGGADGMHKLVSVFTNFMDATARRARGTG
jgi:hypothetical protein